MEYAKLQLRDTRTAAWRLASCAARGATVSLLAYCADVENDGRIVDCRDWRDSQWKDVAGLRAKDVDAAVESMLCVWDSNDLVVRIYDHKGAAQLKVQQLQGPHGKKGGRPRKNPEGYGHENPKGFPDETPRPDQTRPDHPTPPPSPAGERDEYHPTDTPPEGTPTTTTATSGQGQGGTAAMAKRRVDAIDPITVRSSIRTGMLAELLKAFQLDSTLPRLLSEWTLAADGLSLGDVARLLWWRWNNRDPVRLPTGLRLARAAWDGTETTERGRVVALMREWLGRTEAFA